MLTSQILGLTVVLSALRLVETGAQLTEVDEVNVWTSWSPCSTTCGPGISTRQCQTSAFPNEDSRILRSHTVTCNGTSAQIKLCNLKPCPSDQPSTGQTSCSLYNSRTFSGRQYVWEPFVHPTDSCKLTCRAKGEHFYANLPDKADNGTPCQLNTGTAVCVNGVCKQVGCDGVVESAAGKDVCGKCNGDGSSCQTISGIFTSTDLRPGVNYVISIPGGSTNINITELQASRNFLIVQTVDGRYIINNETGSSSPSVVEAAGTIFRHEAKVSPHRKESITSPGPTNITLVLKILVRGSNPGILYSFSVPRDVGEAVIQQIRHRSRPIEIPPESDKDRNVPDSSSRDGNSSSLMKHESKHSYIDWPVIPRLRTPARHHSSDRTERYRTFDSNILVKKSSLTSDHKTSAQNIYESINTTQAMSTVMKASATFSSDAGNLSSERTGRNISHLHVARQITRSKLRNVDNIFQRERHNFTYNNIINRRQLPSVEVRDDVNSLHPNKSNSWKDQITYRGAFNRSDLVLNTGRGENRNTVSTHGMNEADQASNIVTTRWNVSMQIVDNVLKDRQVTITNDRFHPGEASVSDISVQSEIIHLNSLADPNEIENWRLDGKNYDNADTRNTSETTVPNTSKYTLSVNGHGEENTARISGNGNQVVTYSNKLIISESPSKEKVSMESPSKENVSKHMHHSVLSTQKYSSPNVNNVDEDVDIMKAIKAHSQHISAADNSRYTVPRYSQSFKFYNRYKDIYKADLVSGRSSRSKVIHHRQHHSHHTHKSLNISSQASPVHVDHKDKQSRTSSSSNVNHVNSTNPHSTTSAASNSDVTKLSGTVPYADDAIQHGVPESHQGIKTTNTVMRLHNHNTAIEDRKRRLEVQRRQYNDRIREIQDRIRQKHTEIAVSRKQVLKPEDAKVNNNSNSFGISLQRQTELFNTFSLQTSQTANDTPPFSSPVTDSSLTHLNTNPSPSEMTHSDQVKHEYNETPSTASNNVPLTNTRLVTSQTEMSPHIRDNVVPDVENPSATNTQKDTLLRRQFMQHDPTTLNYNRQNNPGDSAAESNINDRNHETSSGSRRLYSDPRIILPPRGEIPNILTADNKQYGNSQAFLASEQSKQENVTGPPSHKADTLPIISNTFSHIPLMNQTSNNQQTLDWLMGSNQVEHEDLNRQTSLNTHSLVYEWRVSGLTQCTHSCGGGIQQTVIVCVDTLTQAVVTDENCRHFLRPKLLAVPCNTRPCSAEWVPGPWSPCTVSCGTGEHTRIVTCQARVSPTLNMTMPSSSCEGQERIPDRQTCSNGPCSSWNVGVWSNCSASCGDSHKSRNVSCVDLNSHVLSDELCTEIKPHSQEPCNLGECGKGWLFTEWNLECSSECGAGVVKRQVFCADQEGSTLPDNRCNINQRPPVTQSCRASKLCGALWYTGNLSQCDVKCGLGNRRRQVICVKELSGGVFAVVGEDNCTDTNKPSEIEPCQLAPCVSEWYMTSWNQCSKTCGTGSRTREVRCLDPDQNPADDCSLQTRPKTRESCNTHGCSNAGIEGNTPDCTDKFSQCSVVKRARLCRYNYYKRMCCKSCAEHMFCSLMSKSTKTRSRIVTQPLIQTFPVTRGGTAYHNNNNPATCQPIKTTTRRTGPSCCLLLIIQIISSLFTYNILQLKPIKCATNCQLLVIL